MDPNDIQAMNRQTVARYDRRLDERGPGAFALGWGNETYQMKRFEALLHSLDRRDLEGRAVLDVGCGLGDLLAFLRGRGMAPRSYRGLDINPRFIDEARRRFPDAEFDVRDLVLEPFPSPVAETGVMLGVINFRHERQWEHAASLVACAFQAVDRVLVVNAISDVHNENYPREDFIHYYAPAEMLKWAQGITPFCSLTHDYRGEPQHEFMLVMRKQPWVPIEERAP